MKFKINITGEFENIKGLRIAQKYYINIKCGSCNTPHNDLIFLAEDNWREMKIKELNGKKEVHNVIVECRNCKNKMAIDMSEPENRFEFDEIFYSPVVSDRCHISTIESHRAVVTNVDGLILDVLSMQDKIFHNCSFDKRTLAEDDRAGHIVDILKFSIDVEEI